MQLWSSLASSLFTNHSKSSPTTSSDEMIAPESPSESNIQMERTATTPTTPSKTQAPAPLPYRSIDPSQTLQLPFHESQKAETPFINPFGDFTTISSQSATHTSSHTKISSGERTSPILAEAAAKAGCEHEIVDDKSAWQDGWVTIVELEKEMEKESFGPLRKRSTKEWRGNEEVGPLRKKSKDHGRSLWPKKSRAEKSVTDWRPEISGVRRVCT
jgi:hypothetical protein